MWGTCEGGRADADSGRGFAGLEALLLVARDDAALKSPSGAVQIPRAVGRVVLEDAAEGGEGRGGVPAGGAVATVVAEVAVGSAHAPLAHNPQPRRIVLEGLGVAQRDARPRALHTRNRTLSQPAPLSAAIWMLECV